MLFQQPANLVFRSYYNSKFFAPRRAQTLSRIRNSIVEFETKPKHRSLKDKLFLSKSRQACILDFGPIGVKYNVEIR
jgi:hypothetical protein